MEQFTPEQTGFWGALAGFFLAVRAYFQYKKKKEENMEPQEKIGIKESKELLDGLNEIAIEIIQISKDGLQVSDAAQVVEDLIKKPEFKAKLQAAVEGVSKVPAEIKDLDLSEGFELAQFEYEGVKKIMEELKK